MHSITTVRLLSLWLSLLDMALNLQTTLYQCVTAPNYILQSKQNGLRKSSLIQFGRGDRTAIALLPIYAHFVRFTNLQLSLYPASCRTKSFHEHEKSRPWRPTVFVAGETGKTLRYHPTIMLEASFGA
ncbi:hypothetical protein CYG49_01905 [Candidatus Saccharibacteria bacterium]|nr:MAG: hypothetical protein CYG49_01905 [Candidatus Saccharibacteria bacterium]